MKSENNKGFTLVETLVAATILLLCMGLLFALFNFGAASFGLAVERQGLQGQARLIGERLRKDVTLTSFLTLRVVPRTDDSSASRRDILSLASLSQWSDPAKFDVLGIPKWDRYVVIQATRGTPGKLFRYQVTPSPVPPEGWLSPLADLSPYLNDAAGNDVSMSSELTDSLHQFEVLPQAADRAVNIRLWLRRYGLKNPNSQRVREENLQTEWLFISENTWPEL